MLGLGKTLPLSRKLGKGLGPEHITNGTFDSNITGWGDVNMDASWEAAFNGHSCIKLVITSAGGYLRQDSITPSLAGAKSYRLSLKYFIPSANTTLDGFRPRTIGGANPYWVAVVTGTKGSWQTYSLDYDLAVGNDTTQLRIYTASGGVGGGETVGDIIYFDDISIKEIL